MVDKKRPSGLTREELSKLAANPRQVRYFEQLSDRVGTELPDEIAAANGRIDQAEIRIGAVEAEVDELQAFRDYATPFLFMGA